MWLNLISTGQRQQLALGAVWKSVEGFVVVVTITGKSYWHLVERRREVENLAMGRTVIFQKATEKYGSNSSI